MSNKLAIQRLIREQQKLQQSQNKQIIAFPNTDNIFEWHFVLYNFENSPYEGGQYHGKLLIPAEYPMKPPTLIFITPQGRFKPGEKICLSFTSFHPESWSTSWTIETMLIALISFMHTEETTAGGVKSSEVEKRKLAKASIQFNTKDIAFEKMFLPYYDRLGLQKGQQLLKVENQPIQDESPQVHTTEQITNKDNQSKKIIFILICLCLLVLYYYLQKIIKQKK